MAEIKCGENVNPLSSEAVKHMEQREKEIQDKYQKPADLVSVDEINDGITICGQRVRPFSAGVIMILEEIQHPLFVFQENDNVDEVEVSLVDMLSLLYILFEESEDKLLMAVENKTLIRNAKKWSFNLDPEWLKDAAEEAAEKVEQFHSKFEVYKSEAESEQGEKKHPAG